VKKFMPLLVLMLLLSGCKLRADAAITVNADESGSVGLEVSLDEELRNVLTEQGQSLDLTGQLDGLPDGWSAEPFVDGEFEGVRATTEFASFAELEATLQELEGSEFGSQGNLGDLLAGLQLGHDGNRYDFTATIDDVSGSFEGAIGDGFGGVDVETLFDSVFEVRVLVSLPGVITAHNGDAIDGSTVTWNIDLQTSGTTLSATSETEAAGPGLGVIVAIVAAVVLLGVAVVMVQRRNGQRARELVAAAHDVEVVQEPGA
jgi:hypothetical protein